MERITTICFEIIENESNNIKAQYCQPWFIDRINDMKLIVQECKKYIKYYKSQENIDNINQRTIEKDYYEMSHMEKSIPTPRIPQKGYIYFILDNSKKVKIGKTKYLEERILQLEKILGEPIILHHFFKTFDITKSEKKLHKKYKQYRLNGEWFNLPKEELDFIKEYYN